jgi:hypothetical protein
MRDISEAQTLVHIDKYIQTKGKLSVVVKYNTKCKNPEKG